MMDKDNCNRNSGGKPVPRDLPFFRQLISCGGRGGKALYKMQKDFSFNGIVFMENGKKSVKQAGTWVH